MEQAKSSPSVGPSLMTSLPALSVEQFLHSLERTPIPTRFHRRRERFLKRNLKMGQEIRIVGGVDHISDIETDSVKNDRSPRDEMRTTELSLNLLDCCKPPDNELGSTTLEKKSHKASSISHNPSKDAINQGRANNAVSGIEANTNIFESKGSSAHDELLWSYRQHRHHDDASESSMFVRAGTTNQVEEPESIRTTKHNQDQNNMVRLKAAVNSDFEMLHANSLNEKNVLDEAHGSTKNHIPNDAEYIAIQSLYNILQLVTKKLRRPGRTSQSPFKTNGNGKPLKSRQLERRIKMPRMLPVQELALAFARAPSNPNYNSDSGAVDTNDDSAEDFLLGPYETSGQTPKQRNVRSITKKRKPLDKLGRNILNTKADDTCKYKLPNLGEVSQSTKKRLKISMKCSDGFEGKESLPTGRTMRMRVPHRHPRILNHTSIHLPELSLASSRDCSVNIEGLPEDIRSNLIVIDEDREQEITAKSTADMTENSEGAAQDVGIVVKPAENSGPENLKSMASPYHACNDHIEENTIIATPVTICKSKRRITFSDVDVLQTLRMVSAPIEVKSSFEFNDSGSSTAEIEEEDEANDESTEDEDVDNTQSESGSSDTAESNGHDGHGVENENRDADLIDELYNTRSGPITTVKPTLQRDGIANDCENENFRNRQRSALDCQNVHMISNSTGSTSLTINSRNSPHLQTSERHGEVLTESHSRLLRTVKEGDIWSPRISVMSCRLIEVDSDILDHPISPHQATDQYMEDLQQSIESQASIELGDPNWQAPYSNRYDQSLSQDKSLDPLQDKCHICLVEGHATCFPHALDSFNNSSIRLTRIEFGVCEHRPKTEACPLRSNEPKSESTDKKNE